MVTTEERLEEEEEHVEGLDGTGSDMTRILGMSDAVFAFSMTFLVVTLVLPQVNGANTYSSLPSLLGHEWPAFIGYVISFFIIAAWWATHRRMFSPIIRYDRVLVSLNNGFLLVIAVTPFLVDVLYVYGPGSSFGPGSVSNELAVALFAVVQVAGGLLMLGIWRHSTHDRHLVEERLSDAWIRRTEQGEIFTVGVFAVSIPLAFLSPLSSMLLWIIMAVGISRVRSLHRRARHRPAASSAPSVGAPPIP